MCFKEDGTPCGPIVENIDANCPQQERIPLSIFLNLRGIASSRPDVEILNVVVEYEISEKERFPLVTIGNGESTPTFED
jgi:hypothetical protein